MTVSHQTLAVNPVLDAVKIVGSRQAIADLYEPKIKRQAVDKWVRRGIVPSDRVRVLANATGIPRERLNPCFKE